MAGCTALALALAEREVDEPEAELVVLGWDGEAAVAEDEAMLALAVAALPLRAAMRSQAALLKDGGTSMTVDAPLALTAEEGDSAEAAEVADAEEDEDVDRTPLFPPCRAAVGSEWPAAACGGARGGNPDGLDACGCWVAVDASPPGECPPPKREVGVGALAPAAPALK